MGLFDPKLMSQTSINSPTLCYHVQPSPSTPEELKEMWGFNFSADLLDQTLLFKAKAVKPNTTIYEFSQVFLPFTIVVIIYETQYKNLKKTIITNIKYKLDVFKN